MSQLSATQGIREEIAARLNEVESENTDQYTNWINLSLQDIQNSMPQSPLLWASANRTLSAGVRVYNNLPSDFDKMNEVLIPEAKVKLTYLTPDEFDALAPSATAGGNPALYTIRNAGGWSGSSPQIEFYYVPASNVTTYYDYQKTLPIVSAGSSVPYLPSKYIELPVLYGEKLGLRRRGQYTESRLVDADYQALKQKMIEDFNFMTNENPRIKNIREFTRNVDVVSDPIRAIFNQ